MRKRGAVTNVVTLHHQLLHKSDGACLHQAPQNVPLTALDIDLEDDEAVAGGKAQRVLHPVGDVVRGHGADGAGAARDDLLALGGAQGRRAVALHELRFVCAAGVPTDDLHLDAPVRRPRGRVVRRHTGVVPVLLRRQVVGVHLEGVVFEARRLGVVGLEEADAGVVLTRAQVDVHPTCCGADGLGAVLEQEGGALTDAPVGLLRGTMHRNLRTHRLELREAGLRDTRLVARRGRRRGGELSQRNRSVGLLCLRRRRLRCRRSRFSLSGRGGLRNRLDLLFFEGHLFRGVSDRGGNLGLLLLWLLEGGGGCGAVVLDLFNRRQIEVQGVVQRAHQQDQGDVADVLGLRLLLFHLFFFFQIIISIKYRN
eukprot:PhM_4_TR9111/c0_g1_i3/m.30747